MRALLLILVLASPVSAQSVLLTFDRPVTDTVITSYQLYRSTNPNNFTIPLVTLPYNATTYTDLQVTRGTTYYYQIVAVGAVEQKSPPSNVVMAAVPNLCIPPLQLKGNTKRPNANRTIVKAVYSDAMGCTVTETW
jgi:fibronectin type 3 domain-containing protein